MESADSSTDHTAADSASTDEPSRVPPSQRVGWVRKAGRIGLWILILLEVLGMGAAGLSKFQGDGWQLLFESWGYAGWFALVIGALELSCALLLAVPRVASYAASVLIVIMLGAIWTVSTNDTELGQGIPLIHVVVLSIILQARWQSRWTPARLA